VVVARDGKIAISGRRYTDANEDNSNKMTRWNVVVRNYLQFPSVKVHITKRIRMVKNKE
jgi:hypothetical protein